MSEVRRIDAAALRTPSEFYAASEGQPVVVTGVTMPDVGLTDVARGIAGAELRVWQWASRTYAMHPAEAVVADARARAGGRNVIDHPIRGTELADLAPTPSFLRTNWIVEWPEYAEFERQVIVSPGGAYTPPHLDGCYQGWQYLAEGAKRWRLYSPAVRPLARKTFTDPGDAVDHVSIEQAPGDLVFFPAGWVHSVATDEPSLGLAGSLINQYQIDASMDWWLIEKTLGMAGRLDLPARAARWLDDHPDEEADLVAGALARHAEWAKELSNEQSWEA